MRRIVFIFALAAFAANATGVSSARFGDIGLYDSVVTNVNLAGFITAEEDPTVPAWAKSNSPPATADYSTNNAALVDTILATATNAIPQPDMSGYLPATPDSDDPEYGYHVNKWIKFESATHFDGLATFNYGVSFNDWVSLGNVYLNGDITMAGGASLLDSLAATTNALAAVAQSATNYTDSAIASADTSYRRYVGVTNVNQSVQYVSVSATAPTTLTIDLPAGANTADWIVYVTSVTNVTLSLPSATWYMADEAYTNDIPPATPTALYFTQMADGLYMLGRQELKPITIVR